jgi:hypothetical protein
LNSRFWRCGFGLPWQVKTNICPEIASFHRPILVPQAHRAAAKGIAAQGPFFCAPRTSNPGVLNGVTLERRHLRRWNHRILFLRRNGSIQNLRWPFLCRRSTCPWHYDRWRGIDV